MGLPHGEDAGRVPRAREFELTELIRLGACQASHVLRGEQYDGEPAGRLMHVIAAGDLADHLDTIRRLYAQEDVHFIGPRTSEEVDIGDGSGAQALGGGEASRADAALAQSMARQGAHRTTACKRSILPYGMGRPSSSNAGSTDSIRICMIHRAEIHGCLDLTRAAAPLTSPAENEVPLQ